MEEAFHRFYSYGLAPNTQKSYTSGQKRYLEFCNKFNLTPIPPSEHTILLFISQLGEDGLAPSTVKSYLAAIRNLFINAGLSSINLYTPRVELVIRGIKRVKARQSSSVRPRLPITPSILLELKKVWGRDHQLTDNQMLWAAVCVAFFGFLRCAEFTVPSLATYDPSIHLSLEDVSTVTGAGGSSLAIRIKHSKTDQFGKGISVFFSRTGASLCPVSSLLDYLNRRGTKSGPLFLFENGQPLSRVKLVSLVREALSSVGMDVLKYCGHSFCIGAATTALRAGISDAKIKMLGRWESSAYQVYLQTPREELAAVSSTLANTLS